MAQDSTSIIPVSPHALHNTNSTAVYLILRVRYPHQVAETYELDRVTGRADLSVHLKTSPDSKHDNKKTSNAAGRERQEEDGRRNNTYTRAHGEGRKSVTHIIHVDTYIQALYI